VKADTDLRYQLIIKQESQIGSGPGSGGAFQF